MSYQKRRSSDAAQIRPCRRTARVVAFVYPADYRCVSSELPKEAIAACDSSPIDGIFTCRHVSRGARSPSVVINIRELTKRASSAGRQTRSERRGCHLVPAFNMPMFHGRGKANSYPPRPRPALFPALVAQLLHDMMLSSTATPRVGRLGGTSAVRTTVTSRTLEVRDHQPAPMIGHEATSQTSRCAYGRRIGVAGWRNRRPGRRVGEVIVVTSQQQAPN